MQGKFMLQGVEAAEILPIMDPKNWTTRKASFLSSGKG